MPKVEGERFVAGIKDDRTCISFLVRPDGTMVTRTRWSGLERSWVNLRRGIFTLLAMLAPALFASCAHHDSEYDHPVGKAVVSPKGEGTPQVAKNVPGVNQSASDS